MSSSELWLVLQVLVADAQLAQAAQQRGDAGALLAASKVYSSSLPPFFSCEAPVGQAGGNRRQRLAQVQRELLLAELLHQRGLLLDHDQLALVDHADAVGHLLGLVDVVRGEDDGDAACRAGRAPAPTCRGAARRRRPPSARRGTGSRGSCASALAISTRRFMPPDSVMILSWRLSHSDRSRSTFSRCAGFGARPNRPRLKQTVPHTVSNMSVCSSCGTRPIFERVTR